LGVKKIMLNLTMKDAAGKDAADKSLSAKKEGEQRLDFLARERKSAGGSAAYTRFVRSMRLVLPLIAILIVWLVVSWPNMKDTLAPMPSAAVLPTNVGQNELLRPHFQSVDSKQQPFNITAHRAMQSSHDPSVIILEKPMADMTLNNGSWMAVEAQRGAYRQKADKLLLEKNVKLYHDNGYQLETEKLLVNLSERKAWSDVEVHGQGPAGTIHASGMQANTEDGTIVFTGPVKLRLNRSVEGL
jgi:lipopolysaccharide export system protein LptC